MGPGVPPDFTKTPQVQRYQLDALPNRAYPSAHTPQQYKKKEAAIFILIPCPNCRPCTYLFQGKEESGRGPELHKVWVFTSQTSSISKVQNVNYNT